MLTYDQLPIYTEFSDIPALSAEDYNSSLVRSHFFAEIESSDGTLKYTSGWCKNLTTDTATPPTNRRDWQASAMGGGATAVASMQGIATTVNATALINTGATFPVSNSSVKGIAGAMVVATANSTGGGSLAFGIILSSNTTVLNIDQWYTANNLAVATTPQNLAGYMVLPGQAPAMWLAVTANTTAPTSADTVLAQELAANGFSRALATFAHTAATTTYTLQKVFSATGNATINNEAVFGSGLSAGGGVMPFESAEPSPPTLVNGDQLTQTVTVTIN
jgi:hypothetical protein